MTETTIDVTIYGASDDLIEFQFKSTTGSTYYEVPAEAGVNSHVTLTAPNRDILGIVIGYGTFADEWGIRVESHGGQTPSWPVRFVPRFDNPDDPAVVVTVPTGTRAHCDGKAVR